MQMRSETKSKRRSGSPMSRALLKSRTVMLFDAIEPKLTKDVMTQLLILDQISQEKPIRLFINSPGGHADSGFAIYDLLRCVIRAPVYTIVTGLAASAATIVMVGTDKDKRLILPHSRVMLHQPSVGVQGTASDIAISAREIIRLRKKANQLFEIETGQPLAKLEEDMHRDFWMNAEEARDYGLIGTIVETPDALPTPGLTDEADEADEADATDD